MQSGTRDPAAPDKLLRSESVLVRSRASLLVADDLRPPLVEIDEVLCEFSPLRLILTTSVSKTILPESMRRRYAPS